METIKLPETDIADMRQFYQEELEKTLKKLRHIKSVLDKLDHNGQSIQIQIISEQTEQVKPTEIIENQKSEKEIQKSRKETQKANLKPVKSKRKQKTGPKPIWEDLIIKRLRHLNRPLTYEELTDDIMSFA
ncbi:MAG: hypothetical protein ACK4RM_09785, partial [Flavobacterium sp.]